MLVEFLIFSIAAGSKTLPTVLRLVPPCMEEKEGLSYLGTALIFVTKSRLIRLYKRHGQFLEAFIDKTCAQDFTTEAMVIHPDNTSSIYSRATDSPKRFSSCALTPIILPIRHDLPEINSLDHQIALARGSTIALETTRSRLQKSKEEKRLSLPELKEQKQNERIEQESENDFYRSCFTNFRELATATFQAIDELELQYFFEPEAEPIGNRNVRKALDALHNTLEESKNREAKAENQWKQRWNISRFGKPACRWL